MWAFINQISLWKKSAWLKSYWTCVFGSWFIFMMKYVYFVLSLVPRRNEVVQIVGLKFIIKINFGVNYAKMLQFRHFWHLINVRCLIWTLKVWKVTTFITGTLLVTGPACCACDCNGLLVKEWGNAKTAANRFYSFHYIFGAPNMQRHPHTLYPWSVFTFYVHMVVGMSDTAVRNFYKQAKLGVVCGRVRCGWT